MSQYTILQYWKKSARFLHLYNSAKSGCDPFSFLNLFYAIVSSYPCNIMDGVYPILLHFIVHKLKLRQAYMKSTHHELSMNYKV